MIIDFAKFQNMQWLPDFTFLEAFKGLKDINGAYIATIAVAYVPVAFVVFAEHIADHKNLSSIIEHDLLEDPGPSQTLFSATVSAPSPARSSAAAPTPHTANPSAASQSSGNASVVTILATAILAIVALILRSLRDLPCHHSFLRNGRRVHRRFTASSRYRVSR